LTEATEQHAAPQRPSGRRLPAALAVLALLSLAGLALGYYWYYPSQLGPEQPIPFSHHFHVSTKGLSCIFCHPGVVNTARAGVPPMEKCLLCHDRIITTYPPIAKLKALHDTGTPIEWARVNDLPDFVFFDHSMHIRRGFDCAKCHGDVAAMDRVTYVRKLDMGYCVQCHRDNSVSHDCYVCHR
jgi:hypothetical protein